MGRPLIGTPKNVLIQIRVDRKTADKLEQISIKKQKSRSQIIREIIQKM